MHFTLHKNYPLEKLHSFNIPTQAKYYVPIHSIVALQALVENDIFHQYTPLILGGGSNILFTSNFSGCVVHMGISGIKTIAEDNTTAWVQAGAGESWQDLVNYALEKEYGGIENLSLIPGRVGAAPIQNIGAYGVELKDVLDSLEGLDLTTGTVKQLGNLACKFGYRDSIFKNELKENFIILNITLKLKKKPHTFHVDYGTIRATLAKMRIQSLSIHTISKAITHIRQSKLPQLGNAGSFFKNPIVDEAIFARLQNTYPTLSGYRLNNKQVKLSAAWLIEELGWKGKKVGNIGVWDMQPLVLVNYGGGTGQQAYELSQMIQKNVMTHFGIQLIPEVNIIHSI